MAKSIAKNITMEKIDNKELYKLDIIPKTDNISFGIITLKNNILSNQVSKFIKYLKK